MRRFKNKVMMANPQTFEEKIEKLIMEQSLQITKLTEQVTLQGKEISKLKCCNRFE